MNNLQSHELKGRTPMTKMTKLLRDGDELSLAALQKIIGYFERLNSPIYLGCIAVEIGYSLSQTQAMIDHLEQLGTVRQLSSDEKRGKYDLRGNIYIMLK
jgi:hypothetical protein